jgi:hypothetical protein
MEKVTIIGGQFATGNGKQGNFVAELDNGEEIFILKRKMSASDVNITPENLKDVKWPIYGLMGKRTFNKRNPNYDDKDPESKEFLDETTTRDEIKRVFRTPQELANVTQSGEVIVLAEKKALAEIRRANKLTDEDIAILQNADY